MLKIQRLKLRSLLCILVMFLLLSLATIICKAPFLLMLTLMIWVVLLVFSTNDIKNNAASLCFLVSFFYSCLEESYALAILIWKYIISI